MKKQLLLLSAAIMALVFNGQLMAQTQVEVSFTQAVNAPEIDGVIDTLWNNIPKQEILVPFYAETVSFTASATWQAVWDNKNVYVIVEVPDDNYYPHFEANTASWLADKVEIYMDVNDTVVDGGGPAGHAGHYQFAPAFDETPEDFEFAFSVDTNDAAYICEYAIPLATLKDKNDVVLDPYAHDTIGFDITIIDFDEPEKGLNDTTIGMGRINWENDTFVSGNESWVSLDFSGKFVFVDGVECETITATDLEETICFGETFEFDGVELSETGVYNQLIITDNGCDSIITLALTVNNIETEITQDGASFQVSSTATDIQWVKCGDAVEPIDGETSKTFTATENGEYALISSIDDCADTSACYNVTGINIETVSTLNTVSLFPNPANDQLNVVVDGEFENANISIYSVLGRIVLTQEAIKENQIQLNIENFEKGIYIVNALIDNKVYNYQIVKN